MTVRVGTRTSPSLSIVSPRQGTACIRPYSRAARSFVSALPLGLEAHLTMFVLSDCFVWVGKLSLFWSGSQLRSLRMDFFVSWSALLFHCNRLAGRPSRWSFTHELVSLGRAGNLSQSISSSFRHQSIMTVFFGKKV